MRSTCPLVALTLAVVACRGGERRQQPPGPPPLPATATRTAAVSRPSEPDQIVLRFPRTGGQVRAVGFPQLDSTLWTSNSPVSPLSRVLAFDEGAGSVAAEDAKGVPVRVDLRLGSVTRDPTPKLTGLISSDGASIYGITADGSIARLTPSGSWTFKPPAPAAELLPQADGSLVVLSTNAERTVAWLLHPPDKTLTDTAVLPRAMNAVHTLAGDRLYFARGGELLGLKTRDLSRVPPISLPHRARSIATTPSGDRIFAALDSSSDVLVIDRYAEKVSSQLALPAPVSSLRMDPAGRTLLAKSASGDTVFVIAMGTQTVVGAVPTAWRSDLPTVAPNGWIATIPPKSGSVAFIDGTTLQPSHTVKGGAADLWLFVSWNGFRPRAAGLDVPVTFDTDLTPGTDSAASVLASPPPAARPETTVKAETTARVVVADTPRGAPSGFTVQFAALRQRDPAQQLASQVHVEGATQPRVEVTTREGVTIYRVIVGPFATREEAEKVARTAGRSYWVYEGLPE